jgi:ATP-binding cassette, subfamily A (ABC1), member 3
MTYSTLPIPIPNGPYSYFYLCLALAISSIAYLLLAWLVTNFVPGKYGTRSTILELFRRNDEETAEVNIEAGRGLVVDDIHLPMVRITNLGKVFKSLLQPPITAVQNFSLNIYKNQITVLLGRKGAGKTTVLNMLTGLMSRSAGSIVVNSHSSNKSNRSLIGFCQQHNSFIPYLTCLEHLMLFGMLRGLSLSTANKQAKLILKEVNMTDEANMLPQTLSSAMQRRLSVANAIIGETKLLVLDEPSSGLDLKSRKELWDLLLRLKTTRAILVTTHDTEEAVVLGDKIAIMESGEVIAYGIIPGAIVKVSEDSLMCVMLPYENQPDYDRVLRQLEARQREFGSESVDITDDATLNDLFLR